MSLFRSKVVEAPILYFRLTLTASGLLLLLSGCATQSPSPIDDPTRDALAPPKPALSAPAVAPSIVTVKRGDTLYAIAFERGLDFRDIAAWNQIAAPYTIFPGQRLLMAPPQDARATPTEGGTVAVAKVAPAPSRQAFQPLPSAAAPKSAAEPSVPTRAAPTPALVPAAAASPASPARTVTKPPEPTRKPEAKQTPSVATTAPVPPSNDNAGKPQPSTKLPTQPAPTMSPGQWRWPTQGKVAVAYGVAGRKGIVIDGAAGQSVSATRDGEVVYAGGGLLGYGQLVIVKHDEVYLSAYGNNSRLLVKEGAKVKAGEPIAEMGASGDGRTGLHFELRKNGRPVDPLSLLKAH